MIKKEILITVKAYTNTSKKYVETSCIAGIDVDTLEWVRLYPIPFRDLEKFKKFKKYSIIAVDTFKSNKDSRPESYNIDIDSIRILKDLKTKKGNWDKRKEIVFKTLDNSLCDILENNATNNQSLGVFKPREVNFRITKLSKKEIENKNVDYTQLNFSNPKRDVLETIPYRFKYSFYCANRSNCPGHTHSIIDWEIGECYRSWRYRYKTEDSLKAHIKNRWLDSMFNEKRDTYFYVGNQNRFRDKFMILGVFYSPI